MVEIKTSGVIGDLEIAEYDRVYLFERAEIIARVNGRLIRFSLGVDSHATQSLSLSSS